MSQTASQKFVDLTVHGLKSWAKRGEKLVAQLANTLDSYGTGPRLFTPPTDMSRSSVWYSGMAVEPAEFSQDLARLQASLAATGATTGSSIERPVPAPH
jgi:hypothetical protein